jgi:hypothetical protein
MEWVKKAYEDFDGSGMKADPPEYEIVVRVKSERDIDVNKLSSMFKTPKGIYVSSMNVSKVRQPQLVIVGSKIKTLADYVTAEDMIVKTSESTSLYPEVLLPKNSVGVVREVVADRVKITFNARLSVKAINYVTNETFETYYDLKEAWLPIKAIESI